jgi:hypothetical protein
VDGCVPQGLSEEGQIEGRNVAIELRSTEQYGEVPSLAAELVQRRVTVIAALGGSRGESGNGDDPDRVQRRG